jgi:predicted small lipoprotein YifL
MKIKKNATHVSIILSIVILSVLLGCGKKGPPLPPEIKGQEISTPFDLKYALDGKKITLSWNHKIDKENAVIKPDGFKIFMAKKTFKKCASCPFKFNNIASVAIPSMEFIFELEKGFKYYFRVQALGEDNMKSEYSKTIQVDYK